MNRSTIGAERGVRLSDHELAVLRTMLEEQLNFRVEQLTQLHHPGVAGPLGSADQEVFASLATGARAALRDVQSALWRMDEGSYGHCVSCDRTIERERLEVLPQVTLCMSCQRGAAG